MRTLRLTQDIITDRLPMKGAGDIVQVDDAFADHLLSLGVAVELKVNPPVARETVRIEKKAPTPASPPAPASPAAIATKPGKKPKSSSR